MMMMIMLRAAATITTTREGWSKHRKCQSRWVKRVRLLGDETCAGIAVTIDGRREDRVPDSAARTASRRGKHMAGPNPPSLRKGIRGAFQNVLLDRLPRVSAG